MRAFGTHHPITHSPITFAFHFEHRSAHHKRIRAFGTHHPITLTSSMRRSRSCIAPLARGQAKVEGMVALERQSSHCDRRATACHLGKVPIPAFLYSCTVRWYRRELARRGAIAIPLAWIVKALACATPSSERLTSDRAHQDGALVRKSLHALLNVGLVDRVMHRAGKLWKVGVLIAC